MDPAVWLSCKVWKMPSFSSRPAGMAEQCFSCWGQDQSATGFSHDRRTDLLLEFLQLSAYGRCRPTETIRRFGKAVELNAGDEGAQYVEIEGWAAHSIVH